MNDQTALLRAICENPDDDTVRLAYADWLEEHDEPTHADFIRTQIEFARARPDDPLYQYVLWRNLAYERHYTAGLQAGLRRWPGLEFGNHVRGFVQDLHADNYRAVREYAGEVFGTIPVWSLRVRQLDEVRMLADLPELRYIRRLNLLRCGITPEALCVLLGSPYLGNLESLDLDNNVLRDDVVRVLEDAMHDLPRLRELWMGGNRLTDDGARRFAQSGAFDTLRTLDLSWNLLGAAGIQMLVDSPRLNGLTRLVVRGYGVLPAGLVAALRSRFGVGAEF